jgi:hypothetical protein
MATAPKINSFSGVGSATELTLSTNQQTITFSGFVDENTIDIQINVNGSGFVSDPTLVGFKNPTFTVPNLSSYPNGLSIGRGLNTIQLRAVDLSGAVSPVSTVRVNQIPSTSFQEIKIPPSGVKLNRKSTSVELLWTTTDTSVSGFNIYASTGPGGANSGYLKVNAELIPASSPTNVTTNEYPLNGWSYDYSSDTNSDLEITVNTVDLVTGKVLENKSTNQVSLITSPEYRYSIIVSALETVNQFSFTHDRNDGLASGVLNNDVFSSVPNTDPLYYVITSVYHDDLTGDLQESLYSPELSGAPLPFGSTIRGIKIRDQRSVSKDYIEEIQKKEPTLSLIPGSTVREVHIEPFSNEIQKSYFLLDFVHRSKSFEALLAIDDPGFTGTSTPVSQSQYKQNLKSALSINDDTAVQSLIDGSFESLASNYGIKRSGLRAAQVNQTYYTYTKPTRDLVVNQGATVGSSSNSSAPKFTAKAKYTIPAASSDSFYNPEKRRYEITVQMTAVTPGSSGNVPANTLDTAISGSSGLSTVNETSASYGLDRQSNLELAEEGMKALLSLDTGTFYGYEKTAVNSPGVINVKVVESGSPEMMRDYDPIRQKHAGGKVDVYVKGSIERTVSETFAFQFQVAKGVKFDVLDSSNLIFRARDSRLSVSNPIDEMLFNDAQDLGLRNHSVYPMGVYDLTGCTIIDYQTIQLNKLIPQPVTSLDDSIEGDYRYRSNNKFTPTIQPVRRVVSVVGSNSGALDPTNGYSLFKLEDPMWLGESTRASDFITVNQVGNVPTGASIVVNDESHVLIGQVPEPLSSIGVNLFTVKVYSQDRSIEYNGPDTENPDYLIVAGSQTGPTRIVRSTESSIPTGFQVSVDYEHDENFVVTYVVNDVLQNLKNKFEKMKHTTADVLVKQAVENRVSVDMTVKLLPKASQSTADQSIRSNISNMLAGKNTGGSAYQSDFTFQVESSSGVDYAVQPFTKLTLQNGSLRVRDLVLNDSDYLQSLSRFNNKVFILTQELPFATTDGGGPSNIHKGVYKGELVMAPSVSLESTGIAPNQFYFIGNLGAVIPGYSDDDSLYKQGMTKNDVEKARAVKTGNRIVVSLNVSNDQSESPSNHEFSATYVVSGDTGSKDLTTVGIEYLTPGDVDIVYKA